ncbi:MAG: L-rhamnose isomerase [Planctomycetia bacterium]|nr:L-rhamnose isomerase [Planctomycetia bacterium]
MGKIEQAYELAKERYAELGVDVEAAMAKVNQIEISLHCWQGDDVGGFENAAGLTGGGILSTGNYPGKARTPDELRADAEKAFSLIPGKQRFNLHAIYLENGGKKVDRDEIEPEHFQGWVDWAKANQIGLDFNPTFFSHEYAADGLTLSHPKKQIRDFWIEHDKRCRKIANFFGESLGSPCVVNHWTPDGLKDTPVDRLAPRQRLAASYDEIFSVKYPRENIRDGIESKLFGIGVESYTVGSHEFCMGYAIKNNLVLTLDAGHFHPTECISDKLTSASMFVDELLLHVSRGVRWDSDHVVIWNDQMRAIAEELMRNNLLERTFFALDYFDGTLNRVAAWTIGTRCAIKALLCAALEPLDALRALENDFNFTKRLALLEELKSAPFGPVWDYYCEKNNVPVGEKWIAEYEQYEKDVQSKR